MATANVSNVIWNPFLQIYDTGHWQRYYEPVDIKEQIKKDAVDWRKIGW